MIAFERRSLWESIKYRLIPSYRRKCDQELQDVIKALCAAPDVACWIEGRLVPHGNGEDPISDLIRERDSWR